MQMRRKYSQEYRQEAVQLVKQSDIPLAQIAGNPGTNANVLRRWHKELGQSGQAAFQGNARRETRN
jgi:transposase